MLLTVSFSYSGFLLYLNWITSRNCVHANGLESENGYHSITLAFIQNKMSMNEGIFFAFSFYKLLFDYNHTYFVRVGVDRTESEAARLFDQYIYCRWLFFSIRLDHLNVQDIVMVAKSYETNTQWTVNGITLTVTIGYAQLLPNASSLHQWWLLG